jgi:SAM-dependent methyltransferase
VVRASERRRYALLDRLGIKPTIAALLRARLESAVAAAEAGGNGNIAVLDAGCGRTSPLIRFRDRIDRLVGVDIHEPAEPLPYLDEFAVVDLCGTAAAFPEGSFELVLSNFTLEHFADPDTAISNLHHWLRPGGSLIVTTVNRRHPFVAAYLGLPGAARRVLQPLVKATAADAHPLIGACNEPGAIRTALERAGFEVEAVETVGNLARAWGRRLPAFLLGAAGDLIAQPLPGRRSTILAVGRKPTLAAV